MCLINVYNALVHIRWSKGGIEPPTLCALTNVAESNLTLHWHQIAYPTAIVGNSIVAESGTLLSIKNWFNRCLYRRSSLWGTSWYYLASNSRVIPIVLINSEGLRFHGWARAKFRMIYHCVQTLLYSSSSLTTDCYFKTFTLLSLWSSSGSVDGTITIMIVAH